MITHTFDYCTCERSEYDSDDAIAHRATLFAAHEARDSASRVNAFDFAALDALDDDDDALAALDALDVESATRDYRERFARRSVSDDLASVTMRALDSLFA